MKNLLKLHKRQVQGADVRCWKGLLTTGSHSVLKHWIYFFFSFHKSVSISVFPYLSVAEHLLS